jgi:hypothetical protein
MGLNPEIGGWIAGGEMPVLGSNLIVKWRYVGNGVIAYKTNSRPSNPRRPDVPPVAWKQGANENTESGSGSSNGGDLVLFPGGWLNPRDVERAAIVTGGGLGLAAIVYWSIAGRGRPMAN